MPRISNFNVFLIVLWWPLPFLPGVGWETVFCVFLLTVLIGFFKLLANATPPEPWKRDLVERHPIPGKKIALAFVGLEVVLILFIWVFGAGREQVEPYASWLAPFAEAAIRYVPKFRFTVDKLIELGLPERANLIVVAWTIAYLAQIPVAALWVPPVLRRMREGASERLLSNLRHRPILFRLLTIFCIIAVLIVALVADEIRSIGRHNYFSDFITNDASLFYKVLSSSTVLIQSGILLLVFLFFFRVKGRTEAVETGDTRAS